MAAATDPARHQWSTFAGLLESPGLEQWRKSEPESLQLRKQGRNGSDEAPSFCLDEDADSSHARDPELVRGPAGKSFVEDGKRVCEGERFVEDCGLSGVEWAERRDSG